MSSTNVLKAERVLVEDRIYRLLPIRDSLKIKEDQRQIKSCPIDDDDDIDPDVPIIHQGDRFISTIYVPSVLLGFVCGGQFKNIQALQNRYEVKINIPAKKNIEAGITIQGPTKRAVSSTYLNITNKVHIARMKAESTHFVSLPVNSSNIQESFMRFKDEVLKKYNGVRGIHPSIFQKPSKLHATVTVLILLDEREKQNSIALLNKCTESFLSEFGEKEIAVHVKGLEIMNDDPSEVDILYAKLYELDDDNRLQILADKVMRVFVDASLSRDFKEQVKLHITLMNTIFREKLKEGEGSDRITFDSSKIMKEFGDYDFGQTVVSEIHISTRYTESSDGYYNGICKMKLKS